MPRAATRRRQQSAALQVVASLNRGQPVIVQAGAGCAKTTLLRDVAVTLVKQGVDLDSVLMLAFSRAAAAEMTTRVTRQLQDDLGVAGLRACGTWSAHTLHGWCWRLVRDHGHEVGLRGHVSILDSNDATDAVRDILRELRSFDDDARSSGRRRKRQDRITARSVHLAIAKAAATGRTLADCTRELGLGDHVKLVEAVAHNYCAYKREHGYADLDDLLSYGARLLRDSEDVRNEVIGEIEFVLLDEVQDLCRWQRRIVHQLARLVGRVVLVLDTDQTIFTWRGASVDVAKRFARRFPNVRHVELARNYRSTQQVLDLANAVTGRCLVAARRDDGPVPSLLRFRSELHEARWVADRARRHCEDNRNERGSDCHRHRQLAILYRRSDDACSVKHLLRFHDVPFGHVGRGDQALTDLGHVRDVLAHLRISVNPSDDIALRRVLKLCHHIDARAAEIAAALRRGPVGPALIEYVEGVGELGATASGLASLAKVMVSVGADTQPFVKASLVRDYYLGLRKVRRALQRGDPEVVGEDLDRLVAIAKAYKRTEDLMRDLACDPPARQEGGDTSTAAAPVVLSTLHGCKGLEFADVIIVGARDGQLPYAHDEQEPCAEVLDEERRLLYVGITRAQERLWLTWAGRQGTECRFLRELAPSLLRRRRASESYSSAGSICST